MNKAYEVADRLMEWVSSLLHRITGESSPVWDRIVYGILVFVIAIVVARILRMIVIYVIHRIIKYKGGSVERVGRSQSLYPYNACYPAVGDFISVAICFSRNSRTITDYRKSLLDLSARSPRFLDQYANFGLLAYLFSSYRISGSADEGNDTNYQRTFDRDMGDYCGIYFDRTFADGFDYRTGRICRSADVDI